MLYFGIVEDRDDPLKLGRCRVRVAGLHTHDTSILPTTDLPWAMIVQPITGSINTAGLAPIEGTQVIVSFMDSDCQIPVVFGVVPSIPQTKLVYINEQDGGAILKDCLTPQGRQIPTNFVDATGLTSSTVTTPNQDNTTLNNAITQGISNADQSKSAVVESLAQNSQIDSETVTTAYDQISNSLGNSIKSSKDNLQTLLNEIGDRAKAEQGFIKDLVKQSESIIPSELYNGKISMSELVNNTVDKFKGVVDINGILPKDLSKNLSSLNINNADEFVMKFGGETLSTLKGSIQSSYQQSVEYASNIEKEVDKIVDSVTDKVEDIFGGIFGSNSSKLSLSSPQDIVKKIGDGFSSSVVSLQNVGNINAIVEKGKEKLSSIDFKEIGEGLTPPLFGEMGGANFGGAEPEEKTPPKQDVTEYPSNTNGRELNLTKPTWINDNGKVNWNQLNKIVSMCDELGLLTIESKAAFLAIGITNQINLHNTDERVNFCSDDVNWLLKTFPNTFKGNKKYAKDFIGGTYSKNISKYGIGSYEDLLNFLYSPSNEGRTVGNTEPTDGYKFRYSGGMIPICGRAEYVKFRFFLDDDSLMNGYSALTEDTKIKISILKFMYKMNLVPASAHPQYYKRAKSMLVDQDENSNIADKLYCHFYGANMQSIYGTTQRGAQNVMLPHSYYGSVTPTK
jgi:phage-related baseplate assembly protein|nr:MAG TPA: baseplate wedge protein [Caudoviricetes sp.]